MPLFSPVEHVPHQSSSLPSCGLHKLNIFELVLHKDLTFNGTTNLSYKNILLVTSFNYVIFPEELDEDLSQEGS
jgi:hypothetical protein